MNYLAQMLLCGKAPAPDNIFQLYESVSHLFAEALIGQEDSSFEVMSDASGIVYNVGFVYNRLKQKSYVASNISGYSRMPDTVAYGILDASRPTNLFENIEKLDLQAYYLATMGFFGESTNSAIEGACLCQNHADIPFFTCENFSGYARDLVPWFLACAVHSAIVAPLPQQEQLFQSIRGFKQWCADELGLLVEDDIINPITHGLETPHDLALFNAWNPKEAKADIDLVAHAPGIGDTFVVAMHLMKALGATVNVWIGQTEEAFYRIWAHEPKCLIVIGGAESRDGLGEFICTLDPTLQNFFQFVSMGPLGVPVDTVCEEHPVTVFTTWTVGDSFRALARYLDQRGDRHMDSTSFISAVLDSPLIRSVGENMGNSFVRLTADACARSITERVRKYGASVKANSKEQLRERLERLLVARASTDDARDKDVREAAEELVLGADPIQVRAAGEVLVRGHGSEALAAILQSMRKPTVSTAEIADFCVFLTNFVTHEIDATVDDDDVDRIEQLGEFQRVFREYSHKVENLRKRQKARGKRDGSELSNVATDLFNSASAFKKFVSNEDRT
jgi:hypothetical protein